MIYTVANSTELYAALAQANGGDTVRLKPADYGNLKLGEWTLYEADYDSPVTIVSANPNIQATISGLSLAKVSNLTFDDIAFDYEFQAGDPGWIQPFAISKSSNITIRNSEFDGDVASGTGTAGDGYGNGAGLVVSDSTGLVLDGNEFHTWGSALSVRTTSNVQVTKNDVHGIRSDGFNFAAVESALIEENYIHDFRAAPGTGDHLDMIQFFTTGTDTPSKDVIIRANTLDIGDGDWTQSIFMRNGVVDQGAAGEEMFYQNVLIEENVILNGHLHGITVGETEGLTIRNNTVLSVDALDERLYVAPTILVAKTSKAVTIESNVVTAINGYTDQADWSLDDNAYVQNTDPYAPGYYADQFLDSSMHDQDGVQGYVVAPDSLIAGLSAGAARLRLDTTPDSASPQFEVTSRADAPQTLVFDATHSYGPAGQILPADAEFLWDFGDGKTATGQIVEHLYVDADRYDVTLRVLFDGQDLAAAASAQAEVGIAGADVLFLNANNGRFYTQGYGSTTVIAGSGAASVAVADGKAVDLGGIGTKLEIPQEMVSRLSGADTFEMSMTLQADHPGASWGEVARVHAGVVVDVQSDGDLNVHLIMTSGEQVSLTTDGISVNDGAAHDISIRLDGASDSLQILIDDVVAGSKIVTSAMSETINSPLVFGQPWGGQNFDGKLSAFSLDVVAPDYPISSGPAPAGTGLPLLDDYILDIENLSTKRLYDDAYIDTDAANSSIIMDGDTDFASLGRLREFDAAEQLSFSVDYNKSALNDEGQIIAWNYKRVGLIVKGDDLELVVAQHGEAFNSGNSIKIENLGLDDLETHRVTVMLDETSDRVQVILDDTVVLDKSDDIDIEFFDGTQHGWRIGNKNHTDFEGEVHDFRIDASAEFVSDPVFFVQDDAALMA